MTEQNTLSQQLSLSSFKKTRGTPDSTELLGSSEQTSVKERSRKKISINRRLVLISVS
jgi:hypothetical protein